MLSGSNQIISERYRRTLAREVSFQGVGLHTKASVTMSFLPAPAGSGIVFCRSDLPGSPLIPAHVRFVVDTSRSTTLAQGQASVTTVEHVLAALSAFEIDDLKIAISGEEPPGGSGSSDAFVAMIESAGVTFSETKEGARVPLATYAIQEPVYCQVGSSHLVAIPHPTFKISYTLHYPKAAAIGTQFFSGEITAALFKEQIAPCRTFSLFEDIRSLIQRGLIKGGSLENAVVIKNDVVFSKHGLHYEDEMVRHKVLDLIGDLSLVGLPFVAHVIAIASGHKSNCMLSNNLWNYFQWRSLNVPAHAG
ncbi:MAG: lpxC [Chlamydiales bacterium]|nr:lpxC [Chlamydiales bacterium]